MFGLGMSEIIVILVVALIFIGPKKLPDLAKSLGKAMGEFKRATNDFKESISVTETPNYKPIDVYGVDKPEKIEPAEPETPQAKDETIIENTDTDTKQP